MKIHQTQQKNPKIELNVLPPDLPTSKSWNFNNCNTKKFFNLNQINKRYVLTFAMDEVEVYPNFFFKSTHPF
jgi:hypothetical protein